MKSLIICIFSLASISSFAHTRQLLGPHFAHKLESHQKGQQQNPHYARLVKRGQYKQALNYTCRKFPLLNCEKVKIVDDIDGAYATTTNYTNTIRVAKKSFEYWGTPSMGWLAAVIGHENQHQNQSMYVRQVAGLHARWGDYYWTAALELPCWNWMMNEAEYFDLSQAQKSEIQNSIDYYLYPFNNDGELRD